MARNRVHIRAKPEAVFAVLSDPGRYPEWVVGASRVRDHDSQFPALGSRSSTWRRPPPTPAAASTAAPAATPPAPPRGSIRRGGCSG